MLRSPSRRQIRQIMMRDNDRVVIFCIKRALLQASKVFPEYRNTPEFYSLFEYLIYILYSRYMCVPTTPPNFDYGYFYDYINEKHSEIDDFCCRYYKHLWVGVRLSRDSELMLLFDYRQELMYFYI